MSVRLTYFVSHPIQYQAPLLRRIAKERGIRLRVVFERIDEDGSYDPGFKREVRWDVALTDGYEHVALDQTSVQREVERAQCIWVHGWQSATMIKVLSLAQRLKKPVLMRGENCEIAMPDGFALRGMIKRRYVRWLFNKCDAFLYIGAANREYYANRGVRAEQLFPVPYAIDNETFRDRAAAAEEQEQNLRAEFDIGPDQQVVLFAAKLMPRKRADTLIEAFAMLPPEAGDPVLVIVGDGELRGDLARKAPNARFVGFVNQSLIPAYYRMADVFVLPSEREPWGLAVNEAMACGTAVVVSDEVGAADDLVNPDTGRVFPVGDARALATAIQECLENAQEIGQSAEARIFQWGFEEDVAGLRQALKWVKSRAR